MVGAQIRQDFPHNATVNLVVVTDFSHEVNVDQPLMFSSVDLLLTPPSTCHRP